MKRPWKFILTLVAAVVCCGALVVRFHIIPNARSYNSSAKAAALEYALGRYHSEFKSYPTGTHKEIVESLFGKNSRNRPYLNPHIAAFRNEQGEIVDDWGTPLRIDLFGEEQPPRALSAGPNKLFGDDDDITSARAFKVGKETMPAMPPTDSTP